MTGAVNEAALAAGVAELGRRPAADEAARERDEARRELVAARELIARLRLAVGGYEKAHDLLLGCMEWMCKRYDEFKHENRRLAAELEQLNRQATPEGRSR